MVHFIKRYLFRTRLFRSERLRKLFLISQVGIFFHGVIFERFRNRQELYEYINRTLINEKSICYLEFGVYKGESLIKWLTIHNNPDSVFWGFDTFEGLPEDWHKVTKVLSKGEFSTEGQVPLINDDRVSFAKGLFQKSLEGFLMSFSCDKLKVVHMDADLYSSTLYVLTKLDKVLKKGDVIIFDEFSSGDEYLAFVNYTNSYLRKYEIIGVSGESFQQVAIKIL